MIFLQSTKKLSRKGFTIVELMVSVAIFAFMTAILLYKYGSFNQGILLTNLAYDIALTIRNAQSYGLNVKSAPVVGGANYSSQFTLPYGVYVASRGGLVPHDQIVFFADLNADRKYEVGEEISTYYLKRGAYIATICVNTYYNCNGTDYGTAHITFLRPDSKAKILSDGSNQPLNYVEIIIRASLTDTTKKKVIVNDQGQISIKDY